MISRVGSYLSQSVYSVATPFHPFGGAVDIIVVQQQDGSFRTTPWYVRFGKFQGVLKGAEKIVKIEVNGVEADFHMFLDNSGEAYFIKEVAPENDSVKDPDELLESSKEDDFTPEKNTNTKIEVQFRDDHVETTESDSEKRFYEFQDEQSASLDGSIELSDFGSNQFDNIEGDTESNNSEVVLFSIDGQILSAPITSMEENTENVQLSTPQFHLGPIEGPEFEGDLEFSNESTWAHYLSDFSRSKGNGSKDNNEDQSVVNLERELSITSVVEDPPSDVKKDVFKSCMALNDLGNESIGAENEESLNLEVKGDDGTEKEESLDLEVKGDERVVNGESSNLEVKTDLGVGNVESSKLEVETDEGVKNEESLNLEVQGDERIKNVESSNLDVKKDEGVVRNEESSRLEVETIEGVKNEESLNLEVKGDEGVKNVEEYVGVKNDAESVTKRGRSMNSDGPVRKLA